MKLREIEHDIDAELAVRLLGWKWLSFMSRPMASHPEYESGKKIRCRQLFSPKQLCDARWKSFFAKEDARDATGEEPLSYAYCSSNGPAIVPKFHLLVEESQ